MHKMKKTAALLAILSVVGAGALAGCNDSKGAEASTPAGSETMANTAVQTDADGKTTTSAPSTDAGTDTTAAPPAGDVKGDAAAGKTLFDGTCQGCHPDGGKAAGAGPALAGNANINPDLVKDRITNGKGAMPPGLVPDAADQENVIAYVMSLQ